MFENTSAKAARRIIRQTKGGKLYIVTEFGMFRLPKKQTLKQLRTYGSDCRMSATGEFICISTL